MILNLKRINAPNSILIRDLFLDVVYFQTSCFTTERKLFVKNWNIVNDSSTFQDIAGWAK